MVWWVDLAALVAVLMAGALLFYYKSKWSTYQQNAASVINELIKQSDKFESEANQLRDQLEQLLPLVETVPKLKDSYQRLMQKLQAQANINEDLQKEKRHLLEIYRSSSLMSGAGQQMLMREIGNLASLLRKHDVSYEISPAITQVVEAFQQEHVKNDEPGRSDHGRGDHPPG